MTVHQIGDPSFAAEEVEEVIDHPVEVLPETLFRNVPVGAARNPYDSAVGAQRFYGAGIVSGHSPINDAPGHKVYPVHLWVVGKGFGQLDHVLYLAPRVRIATEFEIVTAQQTVHADQHHVAPTLRRFFAMGFDLHDGGRIRAQRSLHHPDGVAGREPSRHTLELSLPSGPPLSMLPAMQNRLYFSREVREHFDALLPQVDDALAGAPSRERRAFELRFERYFSNLYESVVGPYGWHERFEEFLVRLCELMARAHLERPDALRDLDFERELTPDWFQRQQIVGYACYVERFGGSLQGVREHLDYLTELGVGYVHLQGVLKPRQGESDGGYAIQDYLQVNPDIGTMDDLEALAAEFRARGISICVDLVLNHCAKEHEWAQLARQGNPRFEEYFYMFSDRETPDAYETTLPEIFPEFAPGSFTWYDEVGRWVWTTFNEYQWDLNWSNPDVFLEMADIMFCLANRGVEVFRLDAVAFLWKRLGTNCQNQPEAHDLLQALRACANIVTPAVVHKAEAIVSPDDLVHYLGTGKRYGKVSNIAYHNTLMVQYWSALASRDTRLMVHTLREFPRTPTSIAWGTYIRCHDDIGWAVTDEDALAVGLSGDGHRRFLSDYFTGIFEGSVSRGQAFQTNERTGDRRVSGSLASLTGLELALERNDHRLIGLSIERMLLGFALMCGWGGIPLIYMGDEIGLLNDYNYVERDELSGDNRWIHRPYMDWEKAGRRHLSGFVEARIFEGVVNIVRARRRTPHLHAQYENFVPETVNPHVFLHVRPHPLGNFLGVYNFSERTQLLQLEELASYQISQPHPYDQIEQRHVFVESGQLRIPPYGRYWLV